MSRPIGGASRLARTTWGLSLAAIVALPIAAAAKATEFRGRVSDVPAIITKVEIDGDGPFESDIDIDIYLRPADDHFWDVFWYPSNASWIDGLSDALQQTRGKYSTQCEACAGKGADGTQCSIDKNVYYESNPCKKLLACRECIWDLDRNYDRSFSVGLDPSIADFTPKAEVFFGSKENENNDALDQALLYLFGPADAGHVCDERGTYDSRTRSWSHPAPSPASPCGRRVLLSGVVTSDEEHNHRMEIHPLSSIAVAWGPDSWRVGTFIDGSSRTDWWWSATYRWLPESLYPSTALVPLATLQGPQPSAPGTQYTPYCFVNEVRSYGVLSKSIKTLPASLGRCPTALSVSMDRAPAGSGAGWLGAVVAGWNPTRVDLAVALELETPGGIVSRGVPSQVPASNGRGPSGSRALVALPPSTAGSSSQATVYRPAADLFPTRPRENPSRAEPRCEIAAPPALGAVMPPSPQPLAAIGAPSQPAQTSSLRSPPPSLRAPAPSARAALAPASPSASPTASASASPMATERLPAAKEVPPFRRWYAWKVETRLSSSSAGAGQGGASGLTWSWSVPPGTVMVPPPPAPVQDGTHEFTLWTPADPRGLDQIVFANATVRHGGAPVVERGDSAALRSPPVGVVPSNPRVDSAGVYRVSVAAEARGLCGDPGSWKYAWSRNGAPVALAGPGPHDLTLDPNGRREGNGQYGPELLTVTVSDPYGAQSSTGELEVRAPQPRIAIVPSCTGGLKSVGWTAPPGFSGAAAPAQRALGSSRSTAGTRSLCDKVQLLANVDEHDVGVQFPKETNAVASVTWSDLMYASAATGYAWKPVPAAWQSLSRAAYDGDRLTIATGGAEKMNLQAAVLVVDRLGRSASATVELTNDFTPVKDLGKTVEHLWSEWRPGQPLPPIAGGDRVEDPLAAEVATLLAETSGTTTRDPLQEAALRGRLEHLEQYGFAKTASARGVALKRVPRPVFTTRARAPASQTKGL